MGNKEHLVLYIDDISSKYMIKGLNNISCSFEDTTYSIKCIKFDWNISNDKEYERLTDVIKKNNVNTFFIDSALYDPKVSSNEHFLGIFVAYLISSKMPRAHIAIVSSKMSKEASFASSNFTFLEKISKDTEQQIIDDYTNLLRMWLESDDYFDKLCATYSKNIKISNQSLYDDIGISLSRMQAQDKLSDNDFKSLIQMLEECITHEE